MKKELREAIENSEDETVKETAADIDKYGSLEAVYSSPGGQLLVKANIADVISDIDTLCAHYATLTLQEFIAKCADMKSKLDLIRALANSPKNKDDAMAALEEALKS